MSDLDLARLSEITGHDFSDAELLRQALTHASAGQVQKKGQTALSDYERLEFLGDRVVGLTIAERLIAQDSGAEEGDLAVRLNAIVRRESLAEAARRAELGRHVFIGKSEVMADGGPRESVLADVFEAVAGAIYLDGGISPASAFVSRYLSMDIDKAVLTTKDAKSQLQELVQGEGQPLPAYSLVSRSGPDHQPVFEVSVEVSRKSGAVQTARATGPSKRAAEQLAAEHLLRQITDD